ncbi:MAG TPA: hypothetical protein ENJ64_02295 [Thiotrichales bacterium]|nr:hypothetical protein [Thiotrichales bacterium]
MQATTRFDYAFIAAGILLAFISALTPHYNAAYYLSVSVFLAGVLPWLVYSIAVPLMHTSVTFVSGLLLLAVHGWLVVSERFMSAQPYDSNLIYVVPLAMSLLLLPLAIAAARTSWKKMMQRKRRHHPDTHAAA